MRPERGSTIELPNPVIPTPDERYVAEIVFKLLFFQGVTLEIQVLTNCSYSKNVSYEITPFNSFISGIKLQILLSCCHTLLIAETVEYLYQRNHVG